MHAQLKMLAKNGLEISDARCLLRTTPASAASDDLCNSKSKRSSQTDINGTSTQQKESNDSVGKNAEPENLKESGKDASFKSEEEQSYVSVKSTKNRESVYNKSRRLGGVRATRSWNRLRNHVKSASLEKFPDHNTVARNRAATTLHHHTSPSLSSDVRPYPPINRDLDLQPNVDENVTAESNKLLHSKTLGVDAIRQIQLVIFRAKR